MEFIAKREGDNLILTVPFKTPTLSKSGKVLLVAGASGKTGIEVEGKTVSLSFNAYIPANKE